ncbi:protein-tyrosine phosphatase-like protein [Cerioporus squamosus]|nr:protein-tyrosine phosphatase-like protein [Cerioporus squamosus]
MAKKKVKGSKDAASAKGQSESAAVCILDDFLFLGPAAAASNAAFLTSNAISHVISIGHDPPTRLELRIPDPNSLAGKADELQYHRLRLVDSAAASPEECVKQAAEILERCRAQKKRVLLHCSAGISRSPTVVVAYLMRHHGMTLKEALYAVISARPAVSPNPHFIEWLKEEEIHVRGGEGTLDVDRLPAKTADRLALVEPAKEAAG